jgi:NhaA family Na+:H+ antiporter
VPFVVVPIFGFANAGVSLHGIEVSGLADTLTFGVAIGLVIGKVVGVYGTAIAAIKLGWLTRQRTLRLYTC